MATAKTKGKKPATKAKAAKTAKVAAPKRKTPMDAARPKKATVVANPAGNHTQTAQLLTVIFTLLALIFLAMVFYAYS